MNVIQAILGLGCIPVGMEYFNADVESQYTILKDLIKSCDYYVLILGRRYGSVHPTTQRSYTEIEYDYALQEGIPSIGFYYENLEEALSGSEESSEAQARLRNFYEKVKGSKLCKHWKNPEHLALNVTLSLNALFEKHPQAGWVRGNSIEKLENIILTQKAEIDKLKDKLAGKVKRRFKRGNMANLTITVRAKSKLDDLGNPWGIDLNAKPQTRDFKWNELFRSIGHLFISPIQTDVVNNSISETICAIMDLNEDWRIELSTCNSIILNLIESEYIEKKDCELFQSGIVSFYVMTKLGMDEYAYLQNHKDTNI